MITLVNFALQSARGRATRMLVVAPLEAFAAWKEDSLECFSSPPNVAVHFGISSPNPAIECADNLNEIWVVHQSRKSIDLVA